MTKGKNKQVSKKGKVAKKGDRHPFAKKEWFQVMAPSTFKETKQVGWTVCKKPVGTQIISDFLKNRVAEITYADIKESGTANVGKKIKIRIDEINGNACFTSFYQYEVAKERIQALLKKRVVLRLSVVAVTSRRPGQTKLNSYAQSSKIRLFRKKLSAEFAKLAAERTCNDFVNDIVTDALNTKLDQFSGKIIPGIKTLISKVKISKNNNVDLKGFTEVTVQPVATEEKLMENPNAKTAV